MGKSSGTTPPGNATAGTHIDSVDHPVRSRSGGNAELAIAVVDSRMHDDAGRVATARGWLPFRLRQPDDALDTRR